jgi:hypothetical protein
VRAGRAGVTDVRAEAVGGGVADVQADGWRRLRAGGRRRAGVWAEAAAGRWVAVVVAGRWAATGSLATASPG